MNYERNTTSALPRADECISIGEALTSTRIPDHVENHKAVSA